MSVTDRRLCRGDFLAQIERIARAKPFAILLREKDLAAEDYERLARSCRAICAGSGTDLILHSHADVARSLGIGALHLPASALSHDGKAYRDFARIAVSVHSAEEAARAEAWGAHYLIAGHVFSTDSKLSLPPRGTAFLDAVCRAVAIPVFAIGGIAPQRMPAIRATAARGVCVMSGLMRDETPERLIAALTS